jgi:thiosulfate dehydrogenase [quinone] large subunit
MAPSSSATRTAPSNETAGSPQNRFGSDAQLAYGILRATFGINIMLHGVSRLLNGQPAFLAYLNHYFEKAPLMPAAILPAFATVLPWAEAILGALLLVGLATRFALLGGSLVLAALVFGTNLAQDWNVAGLQLIYAFIYYYLLVKREQLNSLSVDGIRGKQSGQ